MRDKLDNKMTNKFFSFGDFADNSAYIFNTTTGKVVDTFYINPETNESWTSSGKDISEYGLTY